MEGLWWENVHKAASGLRNAIQLIQLIFDHKPVCTSLCVPQIHLGDREGTVNILRYEPVCSGPSNVLHRGHSAVTARRCRWVLPVSKVNPRWWKYINFLVLSCCYEEILLIFRQSRDWMQTVRHVQSAWLYYLSTVMQKAWRERNPQARIRAAYQAIEINHEWVPHLPIKVELINVM